MNGQVTNGELFEQIKGLKEVVEEKFKTQDVKLDVIEKQTTRIISRVDVLEKRADKADVNWGKVVSGVIIINAGLGIIMFLFNYLK